MVWCLISDFHVLVDIELVLLTEVINLAFERAWIYGGSAAALLSCVLCIVVYCTSVIVVS